MLCLLRSWLKKKIRKPREIPRSEHLKNKTRNESCSNVFHILYGAFCAELQIGRMVKDIFTSVREIPAKHILLSM